MFYFTAGSMALQVEVGVGIFVLVVVAVGGRLGAPDVLIYICTLAAVCFKAESKRLTQH